MSAPLSQQVKAALHNPKTLWWIGGALVVGALLLSDESSGKSALLNGRGQKGFYPVFSPQDARVSDDLTALSARAWQRFGPLASAELKRKGKMLPDWSNDPRQMKALQNIIYKESGGYVGRPNGLYIQAQHPRANGVGWPYNWAQLWQDVRNRQQTSASYREAVNAGVWPASVLVNHPELADLRSNAIGLGQLLGNNYDAYGPLGRDSIGDDDGEMYAMLAYVFDRYGSPLNAWNRYVSGLGY